jgi:hypothetical protein
MLIDNVNGASLSSITGTSQLTLNFLPQSPNRSILSPLGTKILHTSLQTPIQTLSRSMDKINALAPLPKKLGSIADKDEAVE